MRQAMLQMRRAARSVSLCRRFGRVSTAPFLLVAAVQAAPCSAVEARLRGQEGMRPMPSDGKWLAAASFRCRLLPDLAGSRASASSRTCLLWWHLFTLVRLAAKPGSSTSCTHMARGHRRSATSLSSRSAVMAWRRLWAAMRAAIGLMTGGARAMAKRRLPTSPDQITMTRASS